MKTTISINLLNLAYNYRNIAKMGPEIAPMLKCDAYGLGAKQVFNTLYKLGCRKFFVASIEEGIELRQLEPISKIYVLNGVNSDEEVRDCKKFALTPVINTTEQLKFSEGMNVVLHYDTGITRLGLDKSVIVKDREIDFIMSHLSSSDEPGSEWNLKQLSEFSNILMQYPSNTKASLASTFGAFLGSEYIFDIIRPGAALYGIASDESHASGFTKHVVTINARVIQRTVLSNDSYVGYNNTAHAKAGSKVLVVEYGYGDGFSTLLNNIGLAYANGAVLKYIGKISMDYIVLDASELDLEEFNKIKYVELLGESITLNMVASLSQTTPYSILTSLSKRHKREYIE